MRLSRIFALLLAVVLLCTPLLNAQCQMQCVAMQLQAGHHAAMPGMPCCPAMRTNGPSVAVSKNASHATHADVDMIVEEGKVVSAHVAMAQMQPTIEPVFPIEMSRASGESPVQRSSALVSLQSILRI